MGFSLDGRGLTHVWHQEFLDSSFSGDFDGVINDYFLLRAERFCPKGLWTPEILLKEGLGGFAWWSADAIESSTDQLFSPRNLAGLLPTITEDALTGPVLLTI